MYHKGKQIVYDTHIHLTDALNNKVPVEQPQQSGDFKLPTKKKVQKSLMTFFWK